MGLRAVRAKNRAPQLKDIRIRRAPAEEVFVQRTIPLYTVRAVRDAVAAGDLEKIADQLLAMKRLWVGKGLDGLLTRREAEAALVESATA